MDDYDGCFSMLFLIVLGFLVGIMSATTLSKSSVELTGLAIDMITTPGTKNKVAEILDSGKRISYDKETGEITPYSELSVAMYKKWRDFCETVLNEGENQ